MVMMVTAMGAPGALQTLLQVRKSLLGTAQIA
jgi:hypothetical protein